MWYVLEQELRSSLRSMKKDGKRREGRKSWLAEGVLFKGRGGMEMVGKVFGYLCRGF